MSKESQRNLLIVGIIILILFAIFYFGIGSFSFLTKSNTTNDNSNETIEDDYDSNKWQNSDNDYNYDYFNKDNQIESDTDKEEEETLNQESNELVVNKGSGSQTGNKKYTGYNNSSSTNKTITSNIGGQVMSCNTTSGNKCNITLPNYTPNNGYEFIGWSTNPNSHTGMMPGQSYGISNGETLYPITRKDGVTYQVTFDGSGSGISSIGSSTLSCTIKEVYNNEIQPTSCDIILPSIKVDEGYSTSGWSTNPSDTNVIAEGSKVSISSNTTFYAIALGNSYTIEYYSGDQKVGSSNALVGKDTELISSTTLGAEKIGYTFKGWDITSLANNVVYSDSEVVNSLTLTDGDIIRLYAVYTDDIKPVCSFGTSNTLATGDVTTIKLTCTDTGSGLESQTLTSANFTVQNSNGQITGVSAPTKVENGYEWNISVKGTSIGTFNISLNENSIKDKNNNTNDSITSNDFTVNGKTYTATFTKGSNVTSIGATTLSCTTTGSNTSCNINLPNITVPRGYVALGWYSSNTNLGVPNGSLTLTNNVTLEAKSRVVVAEELSYDNSKTKIDCSDAQCAIDKIKEILDEKMGGTK